MAQENTSNLLNPLLMLYWMIFAETSRRLYLQDWNSQAVCYQDEDGLQRAVLQGFCGRHNSKDGPQVPGLFSQTLM